MTVKEIDVDESDSAGTEPAEAEPAEAEPAEAEAAAEHSAKTLPRRVSVSVRSVVIGAVVAVVVGVVGVLGWLYAGARHDLDVLTRQAANNAHAEKVALDYAVNAAEMNFKDINGWKGKLVAGTAPELKGRLTKAADDMEQILVPLEWASTARPLAAKVRSETGGIYAVDCFVSVLTKTIQATEPLQSTATYSVTVDSSHDWQISDVGGIGAVAEPR